MFDIWCPRSGRWSAWVKPVLFSFASQGVLPPSGLRMPPAWDLKGLPTTRENVALVFDLPGGESLRLAMTFLAAGFRPVPLYNALPWQESSGFLLAHEHPPVVDMVDVVEALRDATPELAKAQLPDDAPPIFMLDANRRTAIRPALPKSFDNRSICFPTDFPSANLLLSCDIQRAVVVMHKRAMIEADLTHTLRHWQDAGLRIELKRLDQPDPPGVITVEKPNWYRSLFYRAFELIDFRKATLGGFGGVLPEPSSG
jgi:hypothetical protein